MEEKQNSFQKAWGLIKKLKGGEKWGLKWLSFLFVVIDPWVIILTISSCILLTKTTMQDDPKVATYMNIALAISTGLLGGLIAKNFDDFIEESNLLIRGKSAVRDLRFLLKRLASQEKQIRDFTKKISKSISSANIELIQNYLDNIVENYVSNENVVENSIYDWTEIVPEASEFNKSLLIMVQKEEEIVELQNILKSKEKESEQPTEIKQQLDKKVNEYASFVLNNDLYDFSGSSVGGTITPSKAGYYIYKPSPFPPTIRKIRSNKKNPPESKDHN